MKTVSSLIILVSLVTAATSMARSWGHSSGSKYQCTYYNDIEYIQEGRKTFYYGKGNSESSAKRTAKSKCKIGAFKLQRKYNNSMIKGSGCLTYPSDALACKKI